MCSIVLKIPQQENMRNYNFVRTQEFEKELKNLSKKWRSLFEDLVKMEKILRQYPTGSGINFSILTVCGDVKIVKARVPCKSLRERSIRVIYAYHNNTFTFVHLEIYFKGHKQNEDRSRIEEYLKLITK